MRLRTLLAAPTGLLPRESWPPSPAAARQPGPVREDDSAKQHQRALPGRRVRARADL